MFRLCVKISSYQPCSLMNGKCLSTFVLFISSMFQKIDCRIFHNYTTLAIIPILASEVLLGENKKFGNKILPLVGIEPLA